MKKEYISPKFDTIKVALEDVILSSIEEDPIPSVIGGDDDGGDILDDF